MRTPTGAGNGDGSPMADYFSTILNEIFVDLDDWTTLAQREQPFIKGYLNFHKMGGRTLHSRLTVAGPRGMGSTFADALAIATTAGAESNGNYADWEVPVGRYDGYIQIPVENDLLSKGEDDSGARAIALGAEQQAGDFFQGLVRYILATPFAPIGQAIYTTGADTQASFATFVLAFYPQAGNLTGDALNAGKLQIGDQIEGRATLNGAALAQFAYVNSVNLLTGAVRLAATTAPGTPASPGAAWVNGTTYFIFKRGDGDTVTTNVGKIVAGLGVYIPDAPDTGTLFGVNRAVSTALSGARLQTNDPAATAALPTRVEQLLAVMRTIYGTREGVDIICNPLDWRTYASQLDTKTRRDPTPSAKSGYNAMVLNTPTGTSDLISEPEQPRGRILLVPKGGVDFCTPNGEMFDMVRAPGGEVWRVEPTANNYEARPMCRNKLYIGNPWRFGVVSAL
jgi:hypothetical protein